MRQFTAIRLIYKHIVDFPDISSVLDFVSENVYRMIITFSYDMPVIIDFQGGEIIRPIITHIQCLIITSNTIILKNSGSRVGRSTCYFSPTQQPHIIRRTNTKQNVDSVLVVDYMFLCPH